VIVSGIIGRRESFRPAFSQRKRKRLTIAQLKISFGIKNKKLKSKLKGEKG